MTTLQPNRELSASGDCGNKMPFGFSAQFLLALEGKKKLGKHCRTENALRNGHRRESVVVSYHGAKNI